MKLPDKITSYKESVLRLIPIVLDKLSICDITPKELFETVKDCASISEFIDVLDCLFVLGKVELIDQGGLLHYVA